VNGMSDRLRTTANRRLRFGDTANWSQTVTGWSRPPAPRDSARGFIQMNRGVWPSLLEDGASN